MEENTSIPHVPAKRSILQIIYGLLLILLSFVVIVVFIYNMVKDQIPRVYVGDIYPVFLTYGSPLIPILVLIIGVLILIASRHVNKLLKWSIRIGFIPLLLLTIILIPLLFSQMVPIRMHEDRGQILLILFYPILLLFIFTVLPLLFSVIVSLINNKKYLLPFIIAIIFAISAQWLLTSITLPVDDPVLIQNAVNTKDPSLCDGLREGPRRFHCYKQVALHTGDKEICNMIPDPYRYTYLQGQRFYFREQCLAAVEKKNQKEK